MLDYLKQPMVKFLLRFAGLYILWFLLYDVWLHQEGTLDARVAFYTIWMAEDVLQLFGYVVVTDSARIIAIEGTSGLSVGDACNAVTLVALFAGFILAYPSHWRRKFRYIGLGAVSIVVLNVLRIVVLAIIDTVSREWTEFNHTYTFTFLMYGYIFLLWYWFVKRDPSMEKDA
ncbi:MAG: exosortase X [Flavobacteriales bacterium]